MSAIADIRKRVYWASAAVKVSSVLVAFQLLGGLDDVGVPAAGYIAAILLAVLCWWLAPKLRAGSKPAAWMLGVFAVAGFCSTGAVVFKLVNIIATNAVFCRNATGDESRYGEVSGIGLYTVVWASFFWLLRGVIAVLRYPACPSATTGSLAAPPWEKRVPGYRKRPILANRRNRAAYVYLAAGTAASYLGLAAIAGALTSIPRTACYAWLAINNESAVLYGRALGSAVGAPLLLTISWLPIILLYRRARRHAMVRASALAAAHPGARFILYLRSFSDDKLRLRAHPSDGRIWPEMFTRVPFEQVVADRLWHYANVHAIGRPADPEGHPADKLAPLGAARDYLPDYSWHETVLRWMAGADLICSIAGAGRSYHWEISQAIDHGFLSKLVFLLPPVANADLKQRWRSLTAEVPALPGPAELELRQVRAIVYHQTRQVLIQGRKHDDWTYEAALDAAASLILDGRGKIQWDSTVIKKQNVELP